MNILEHFQVPKTLLFTKTKTTIIHHPLTDLLKMTSPNNTTLPIDPQTASISTLEAHLNAKAQKNSTDAEQVSTLERGQKAQPGTLPFDAETASHSTLEAQKHPTDLDNLSLNVPEQVSALEQGKKAQPGTFPFDPETASLSTLEAYLNAEAQKHSTDKKEGSMES
jgi:hypothetical protein